MLMRIALTSLFIAPFLACAQESGDGEKETIEKAEVGSTPNVTVFDDKVYFGGQPKAGDVKKFSDLGVTTVINLRTEAEMKALGFDEKAAVEEAGMTYVHLPMGREEPTDEFIAKALKSLGASKDGKVLLHCGSSNRVGYVWSLFAAKERGLSEDDAIAEGKAAGMRAPQLEEWAKKHIEETPEP
jgi:uncharacterized protein (TIGR01244 family)